MLNMRTRLLAVAFVRLSLTMTRTEGYKVQAIFRDALEDLASLAFFQEIEGPYHINVPTPDDIHRFLQLERVESNRGHQDHLPASLAHMLYCIVAEEQYNLAYFFVKRIECARATSNAILPYGMVMRPLALKQTQKPQSDRGMPKARHSVSSSFAHHYGSSSHHGDENEDDDASRASTPSPTTYLNSLSPLNYQNYDIPTSSQQDDDLLFERQTALLNQTQKLHEEVRGGLKSFEKALKGVFSKKKK
ncbi:hypothetical protein Tco_0430875 [Tanacetum coccineum]